MEGLTEDARNRLVYSVRSPLQRFLGALGILGLAWLVALVATGRGSDDRRIGLAGASAVCLLAWAVSETTDVRFDARQRRVMWTRRIGLRRQAGELSFDDIQQVVVRTAVGSSAVAPHRRVVLVTAHGELPLSAGYVPGHDPADQVERIRAFIGRAPGDAAAIEQLVADGHDLDAIRELRLRGDLSLVDARAEIARIREQTGRSPHP